MNLEETNFDYALVIDFDGPDDWRAYREHPDHLAFAKTYVPRIAQVETRALQAERWVAKRGDGEPDAGSNPTAAGMQPLRHLAVLGPCSCRSGDLFLSRAGIDATSLKG